MVGKFIIGNRGVSGDCPARLPILTCQKTGSLLIGVWLHLTAARRGPAPGRARGKLGPQLPQVHSIVLFHALQWKRTPDAPAGGVARSDRFGR